MVQLNTTYDKTLKQKIFVLKGEEAYARTTDVLADIISDFDDCNSHIRYCRVGLEVDVLREVGDAFVNIYDDDTMLLSIPWGEDMESIINNSYYNDKGIYWQNDKLVIGSSDNVDTGLFLSYDTLHSIRVDYTGNKQCLGSKSDVISFMEEKPDSYASSISAVASSVSVETGDSVAFTLNLSIPTSDIQHTVQVYDNGSLIDTLSIDANEDVSYSKSGLSNGLHSIRFLFIGDEEAFSSETTVDVSVGYKLLLVDVPSYAVNGQYTATSVGVSLTDYLDNPLSSKDVSMVEYIPNWGYEQISQPKRTNDDGYALIEPVYVGTHEICAYYMSSGSKQYYSERVTVPVYTPESIDITPIRKVIAENVSTNVRIQPNPLFSSADMNVPVTITRASGTTTDTITVPANSYGVVPLTGDSGGDITVSATLGSVTGTDIVEDTIQYWSISEGADYNRRYYEVYTTLSVINNGYKLQAGNSSANKLLLFASMPNVDLLVEFDVQSSCQWFGIYNTAEMGSVYQLNAGDTVSITYTANGSGSWNFSSKVNGVTIDTDQPAPSVGMQLLKHDTSIVFDNLKIKRI